MTMTLTVVVVMVAVVVVVTTPVMVNVEVTSVVVAIVARPRGCAPTPAIVVAPLRGVGVVRLAVELLVDAGGHDGVHRVECRTG